MTCQRMIRKLRRILFWLMMTAWVCILASYWSYVAVGHLHSNQDPSQTEVKRDAPVREGDLLECKPVECKCESLAQKVDTTEQPRQEEQKVSGVPTTSYPLVELKSYIPNYYTMPSDIHKQQLANQNTTLVFVHSQKASATMKSCIRLVHQYVPYSSPQPPEVVYDDVVAQFYRNHAASTISLGKFYFGEATFGVCELSHGHKPCAYYTILREPYERAVSLYDFCREAKNAKERVCNLWNFKGISVTDYARALGSHLFAHILYNPNICTDHFDNKVNDAMVVVGKADKIDMSRRAFCWYRHKAFIDHYLTKEEKDKLLDYVLENLENWFSVIGLFEEYPLSLELLEEAFGVPFKKCAMWKRNQFEEKRSQAKKNERTVFKNQLMADRTVYESLYYDLRIYDEALKIFHLQKAKFFNA